MSCVNDIEIIYRLYEYFYESLKTLVFLSKKFEFFLLIYKDGKPKL